MVAQPTATIRDLASLRTLTRGHATVLRPGAVTFAIPAATATENVGWEQRLVRYKGQCGCVSGAVALLVALAVLTLSRAVLDLRLAEGTVEIAWWAGVGLAAAVTGKLAGLARAHWALRRLEREIAARIEVQR